MFTSSVHYKEMLEQVAVYNKYLRNERQDRLPYLDSQTGVAQSDCFIWRSRSQRRRGNEPGQVYSYPPIKWKMEFHRDIPSMCTMYIWERSLQHIWERSLFYSCAPVKSTAV